MRRASLPVLIVVLALTIGLVPAQAHFGHGGPYGPSGDGGQAPSPAPTLVHGVVVSSDATTSTIVATLSFAHFAQAGSTGSSGAGCAKQSQGSGQGDQGDDAAQQRWTGGGPTPPAAPASSPMTITTDANTLLSLNGKQATVADFTAGTQITVLLDAAGATSLTDALAKPALSVIGLTPRQFYGFVGAVTAVDATAGTVTVNVAKSAPASEVPAGSPPVSFTVSDSTLVIAHGARGALSDVAVGDLVAGGLFAPAGLAATDLVGTPLFVLIDVPAGGGNGAANRALHAAQRAAGVGGSTSRHASRRAHQHHARRHGRRR